MQKISNYILKGEGLGVKYILFVSIIISLLFSVYVRISGAEMIPYANDIINQMLPIKIENGVVVAPQNTIRVAQLKAGDVAVPLPIVLDTTIDTLDTSKAENGFYLTRTAFYAINDNEVRMHALDQDIELPQSDYTDPIKSFLTWISVFMFFGGALIIFVTYFVAAIFYSLCAQILGLFFGKKYNFDMRMRMSVLSFLAVYVFYFILEWCGLNSGKLVFFITMLILQAVIIYKLPNIKNEVIIDGEKGNDWPTEISEEKSEEKVAIEEIKEEPKTEKKPAKKEAKAPKAASAKPAKKTTVSKKAPAKKTPVKKKAEK